MGAKFEEIAVFFYFFRRKFEAKLKVLVKLMHKKRIKRLLSQFWLEIRILTTLTENFTLFQRNFQAKTGFILLPFTDRLPPVKYCNLPITGGKGKRR